MGGQNERVIMSEFERIINDSLSPFHDIDSDDISADDLMDNWDPIMGDDDDWIDTDDEWLDDFQGEEDFA